MALATGAQLGRYKIRSQIGAGGMGEVLEQAWEERESNLIYLKQ
jgi:ABC-type proline/glycine betaine transport system permease subunit